MYTLSWSYFSQFFLLKLRFLSFLIIPIDSIHEKRSQNHNHGDQIVIRSVHIDLPALPAERKDKFYAPVRVDQEEVEDEMRADTDDERDECFSDILEEDRDDAGNKECADGRVEGGEELGGFPL